MTYISKYLKHETKRNTLFRFLLILLIVTAYFVLMSIKYGVQEGFLVTLLTWSFFVFCTPIADAGFLIDFPIRLVGKVRMVFSELGVWLTAATINVLALTISPSIYQQTEILKLFHHILSNPFPYWLIIVLSAGGTFFSIYFGDELIDVTKHKHRVKHKKHRRKHWIIIMGFLGAGMILLYVYLIGQLGINIPLV